MCIIYHIEITNDIYADSTVTVHIYKESEDINIKRSLRHMSPELVTATPEYISHLEDQYGITGAWR